GRDVVERAGVRYRGGEDAGEGRVGLAWVVVERELGVDVEQVLPVLRHTLDDAEVGAERRHTPVVAGPEAAAILHRARDRLEVGDEVLRVEALVRRADSEARTDVDGVRGAALPLQRDDRLDLLARASLGVV